MPANTVCLDTTVIIRIELTVLSDRTVLVDKPITPDAALALELRDLAKLKGLVLYPFQNRRWDSDYLALKSLLSLPPTDPQSLGGLVEFESQCVASIDCTSFAVLTRRSSMDRYRNALKGTWKDEAKPAAGQLFDLGSHLIDQALALFGRPATVTGITENVRGLGSPDVDDSVRLGIANDMRSFLTRSFTVHGDPALSGRPGLQAPVHGYSSWPHLVRARQAASLQRTRRQGHVHEVWCGRTGGSAPRNAQSAGHSRSDVRR